MNKTDKPVPSREISKSELNIVFRIVTIAYGNSSSKLSWKWNCETSHFQESVGTAVGVDGGSQLVRAFTLENGI